MNAAFSQGLDGSGAAMTDEAELIGLLHRADWTKLRLSAR